MALPPPPTHATPPFESPAPQRLQRHGAYPGHVVQDHHAPVKGLASGVQAAGGVAAKASESLTHYPLPVTIMASNSNLLAERFNEVSAISSVKSIARILEDLACDPSTKRFANSRLSRRERWAEVIAVAQDRVQRLGAAPQAAAKRTVKRATTPAQPTSAPITVAPPPVEPKAAGA